MLCDADTHYVPFEVFKEYSPEYLKRLEVLCPRYDIDARWQTFYNTIKDDSWSECKKVKEFVLLPDRIKQEIKEEHQTPGLFISDNLDFIHYDIAENEWPRLDNMADTGKFLLKTDRQMLNNQGISYTYTNPFFGVEFMKVHNRVMKTFCDNNPRFDTTMLFAPENLSVSMDELERTSAEGFFGLRLIDHHPWGYIEQCIPVFEFCSKQKIPVYLHLSNALDETPANLTWNYQDPTWIKLFRKYPNPRFHGKGLIWIVAIMSFITSGLLDRLPELRIVSAEHGLDWIPELRAWCEQNHLPDPMPYFKNNFWFTIEMEEPNFLQNARSLGWDRLLYATDYPHNDPGGRHQYQDLSTINTLLSQKELTVSDFDLVTHQNYIKLHDRI